MNWNLILIPLLDFNFNMQRHLRLTTSIKFNIISIQIKPWFHNRKKNVKRNSSNNPGWITVSIHFTGWVARQCGKRAETIEEQKEVCGYHDNSINTWIFNFVCKTCCWRFSSFFYLLSIRFLAFVINKAGGRQATWGRKLKIKWNDTRESVYGATWKLERQWISHPSIRLTKWRIIIISSYSDIIL